MPAVIYKKVSVGNSIVIGVCKRKFAWDIVGHLNEQYMASERYDEPDYQDLVRQKNDLEAKLERLKSEVVSFDKNVVPYEHRGQLQKLITLANKEKSSEISKCSTNLQDVVDKLKIKATPYCFQYTKLIKS